MNIKFTGKEDGSTLATVVLIQDGISTPSFYRMTLPPEIDPWTAYSEVAQTAYEYLTERSATERATTDDQPTPKKMGRVLQLQGVLT